MDNRVAVISIIVTNSENIEQLNKILHEYAEFVIGRMGIPYKVKNINIICLAVDAPQDVISALSGKLGRLNGVTVKTALAKA
ncbi:MAG: iron-only hydrogenase system regulator [Phascolarctobacterium sp.]|nr:iron-only hydrogenase system regulator [Phascolarctobacterium sp.]